MASTKTQTVSAVIIMAIVLISTARFALQEVHRDHRQVPASLTTPEKKSKLGMASIQKVRATVEAQSHALQDLIADRPFVLVADGRAQRFTLSLSELYATTAATNQRFKKVATQPDARHLIQTAKDLGAETTGWVLYPEGREGEAQSRQILHKRIHIQTNDRERTVALLKTHGLKLISEPDYSPGSLIVEPQHGGPEAALKALEQLSGDRSIQSIGPLLLRQMQKHFTPNDTLFTSQWHLKNTGQGGGKVGSDMNVSSVWDTYKGSGIRIAIVDDGLDILHPDLAPNADSANHYDWNDSPKDTNPAPNPLKDDSHGTSVGGVAAARGNNNLGVSGVAPQATLVGFRLISDATTDADDADAMSRGKDIIHIKNNSWGSGARYFEMEPAGPLFEAARRDAALTGRSGKGTIFVWSAGNGREEREQGQKDGIANSMYITTVGATTNSGALTSYSETGSHLVVCAPSSGGSRGVVTTDLQGSLGYNQTGVTQKELADLNYTNDFGGTSSSAPAVSGAVALLLEVNPGLNWRDVKEILLRSSTKLSATSAGWVSRNGGNPSLALIKHHESFGGGGINVQAAVTLAETWTPLGPMLEESRISNQSQSIPENNTQGIKIVFDFSNMAQMRIEHAKLRLDITHPYRGDLEVKLTSPAGSTSTLATKEVADSGQDYFDAILTSVRHWGEAGKGLWILSIKDLGAGDSGQFNSAELSLYGTDAEAPTITNYTNQTQFLAEGQPLNLSATTSGGGNLYEAWIQNLKTSHPTSSLAIPAAATSHAGRYQFKVTNAGGSDTSDIVYVSVVNRTLTPTTINLGAKGSVTAQAAGDGLSYEWRLNGQAIPIGGKYKGMTTQTLSVSNMQPEDTGPYTCIVRMSGVSLPIETLPLTIEVRYKPIVTFRSIDDSIVSGAVNEQIAAINGTTGFTASGLPKGVTISPSGLITGRASKPGTYKVKIAATNLAGSGPPTEFEWDFADFPLAARGVWTGIVQREAGLNADFGGRVKITVSNTGTYTGSLTLGAKTYAWSSRIDALLNDADPTTPFTILRGKVLTPLTGNITLNLTTGTLTGTISDGIQNTTFKAERNPWSATNKPVEVTTSYNTALEVPIPLILNPLYPQGHGHTKLTIGTTGTVTWAGKLADATTLTGSTTLGPLGQTSIHSMLYLNTGSIQGWGTVTLATGLVDGSVDWLKSPQLATSTTRSYKGGIPLHILTIRGAKYGKPLPPSMIIDLDSQPLTGPLLNNAKLRFTGLPLDMPLEQSFKVTHSNTATVPTLAAENPQSVRLSLSAATGTISGTFSFKNDDPFDTNPPYSQILRTGTYSGLLITRPDLNQGVGYFNLAELPDTVGERATATPNLSGKVEVIKP